MRIRRQERIRELLAERGRLGVEELAEMLDVTTMTIRRDLTAMEKAGLLTRTHGGFVLHSPFVQELPFVEKDRLYPEEKRAIAHAAAKHIRRGMSLYLDTGTTAVHLARALPPRMDLRVFTNNLRVAMELFGREDLSVLVYGGELAPRSPDLIGPTAMPRLRDFHIDIAFAGADALDTERAEFYSAEMGTAMLSKAVQEMAGRTIALVDGSKFGKRSQVVVGRLGGETLLVTDSGVADEDRQRLKAHGARVEYADA